MYKAIFNAIYNDGRTAARREVQVQCGEAGLDITSEDGAIKVHWGYGQTRIIDPPRTDRPLRLASLLDLEARLISDDPAFMAALRVKAPHLFLRGLGQPKVRRNIAIAVLVLAGMALFLWQGVPRLSAPLAQLVPLEWEQKIGAIVRKRVLGGAKICHGSGGAAALDIMTQRLTSKLENAPVVNITVADRAMVNAFAMPGGNIVIFRGLLQTAESADEVAAVLAHEMGHVQHRHPTQIALRAMGIGIITDLLTGDGSAIVELAGEVGGLLLLLSYSRDMERQADAFGRDLFRRGDLPMGAQASLFARLRDKAAKTDGGKDGGRDGGGLFGYFNSHPPLEERIASSGDPGGGHPVMDEVQWKALKNICS